MTCPSNPELGSGGLPEVNMFLHLQYLIDSKVSQVVFMCVQQYKTIADN